MNMHTDNYMYNFTAYFSIYVQYKYKDNRWKKLFKKQLTTQASELLFLAHLLKK